MEIPFENLTTLLSKSKDLAYNPSVVRPLHFLFLFFLICIWGVSFTASKIALQTLPPIFLCFLRFALSSIPFIFFVKRPPIALIKLALYGFLMFALQFSLLFSAMKAGITPALASVLLQCQAFFAIGLGIFFLKESYRLSQTIGALTSFLGIFLIASHIGGDITFLGLFFVLSAAAMWATGSLLVKKMEGGQGFPLVIWSSFLACPPLFLLSYFLETPEVILKGLTNLSWLQFGSIFYVAYFGTLTGFGLWNYLHRFYPLSKLAPFTLLVPIVGILSSVIAFNEPLPWWKITATLFILGGLCINVLTSKSRASISQKIP
ncbi:MAG: O-acetylserine/cysteine exporter [Chlamydiae bacterium]|nr:O-acetylserine/cysteine exporter [Chlamydiota bacterium]